MEFLDNKDFIVNNFKGEKMKNKIIIAGFSGIGKTVLASKYKNVLDLDAAEYAYDDSDILDIPFEKRKGGKRKTNPLWPQNYIKAINKAKDEYDIILVWDREDIIKEYINNGIDFILCYPVKDDLNNYIKRYRDRGNSEKYIKWKIEQYDEKMEYFKNLDVPKIILANNDTIETYLIKQNYNLVKKE